MIPYHIDFQVEKRFDQHSPNRFLLRIDGKIFSALDNIRAGNIVCYKLLAQAMNGQTDDPVMALAGNDDTEPFLQLYEGQRLKEQIKIIAGMDQIEDLFIIAHLYIFPNYRRHQIGLAAIANSVRLWADNAICVLKAFPLQLMVNIPPGERSKYRGLEKDPDKAFQSLRKYYRKLGFKQLDDTKCMVLGQAMRTKLFDQLCPALEIKKGL